MRMKSRSYLFKLTRTSPEKECVHCGEKLTLGDIVFSKRGRRYYCTGCMTKLGYVEPEKLSLVV